MVSENETVTEITGRMRRIKLCIPRGKVKVDDFDCVVEVSLSDFANRIEAAYKREVAELKRRIKVAEDALIVCKNGMCRECRRHHSKETCVNGCYDMDLAKEALAVIRGEGAGNGK